MAISTSIKTAAIALACAILLSGAGFLVIFPHFAHAMVVSKSPYVQRAADQAVLKMGRSTFVDPIEAGIRADDIKAVRLGWQRYATAKQKDPTSLMYIEDPLLRLRTARYHIKKGAVAEAHEQLNLIVHPPKGSFSSLQASGEVMSLWEQTAQRESLAARSSTMKAWQDATRAFGRPSSELDAPSGHVRVEYLAAQELEAQTKPKDALQHYQRAVTLQPGSSFLWKALGQAKLRAGDFAGSKTAMVHAYWTAPAGERDKIKLYNQLSEADIARVKP